LDKDRRTAFLILKNIEEKKAWSNIETAKYIQREKSEHPAFIRELVYGILRNKYLLDYNIDKYLKKPKLGVSERLWLRMGFYQLAFMDGVSDYAAINETVELARKFKKGSEGFINAVLRNFQRDDCTLKYPEKDQKDYLSVKYSVDRSIADLWVKNYGFDRAEEMLFASNTPAPLSIRVNTLKTDPTSLVKKLNELGFESEEKSLLSKDCIYVSGSGLLDTDLYHEGYFSVQGEASQYAVKLLGPKEGSTVLDLCAAPGGKSCAMAELMKDKGSVLSFDIYDHRISLIEKEAKRLGINIIKAQLGDGTVYNEKLNSFADYVLADVPCSGLGTLRENPEIKYRKPDEINVQAAILLNALKYVKPGGFVLYSTCTVNPLENEEIIKNCNLIDSSILHGNSYEEGKNRGYKAIASRQLLPKAGGHGGFYLCLIKRIF